MKKLFSVILCMALMLSTLAVPALADDAFCKKVDLQNVKDAKSSMGVEISEEGVITGTMKANKKEVNINFDGVDLTPYVDNGYLAFCITMSEVPTKLRVYPYSVYTDEDGEHALRPNTASTPSLDGMKADTPFWIYLPLKSLIGMEGTCKTSSHIDAEKKVTCNGQYTLTSFGKLIIQPDMGSYTFTDGDSSTYVDVTVQDLGLYVYKTEINGVSKDGYWMPIANGSVTDGTDLKLDSDFIYDKKISTNDPDVATSFISSEYVMNDGYITFKPNATKKYGLSFYLGIDGLTLPVSKTYLDNKVTRWNYEDYTLKLKIKSANVPKELYIGAMSGYSSTKRTGQDAGGIRPIKNCFTNMKVDEWFTLDISLYDFIKGNISDSSKNTAKTLGSITLFFRNTDETPLSDIDIAEMAIYGPSRGLTVTNLQITKDSEETAEYSAEDTLTLTAKASNTTSIARSFSTIGAFYNGNQLAGVEIFNIEVPANTTDVPVTKTVTVPEESTTKFKAFAFSNLKDITPLCESKSAYAQIAQ